MQNKDERKAYRDSTFRRYASQADLDTLVGEGVLYKGKRTVHSRSPIVGFFDGIEIREVDFDDLQFVNSVFTDVDFRKSSISKSVFASCAFWGCSFDECRLSEVSFEGCLVSQAAFTRCDTMEFGCYFSRIGAIVFEGCTMESTVFLGSYAEKITERGTLIHRRSGVVRDIKTDTSESEEALFRLSGLVRPAA